MTIKLCSWQPPVQGTLSLETFLTHYDGYVAADPPQQFAAEEPKAAIPRKTSESIAYTDFFRL